MGLETGTSISDLVITNPTSVDVKSQGDDHFRLLKTVLRNCFAGFTGAVFVTGTDGGAVNAYTLTPTTTLPAYGTTMEVVFAPTITNTGASTLNISGLGTKDIKSVSGAALVANDLVAGSLYAAFYNGTEFRLLSITKNYADQLAMQAALPAISLGLVASPDGVSAAFSKSLAFGLNEAKAADVASAAAPDIWAGNGNTLHITGTTTFTGFAAAPQAGAWRKLYFDGSCLLTNGANFNVQGGANYTTAAGDTVMVYADTTTKFYLFILPANGLPLAATPFLHVRDESAEGGSSISGTQDRVLNTVVTNTISGASLASNIVTLPAGTYDFEISAPAYATSQHRASLYNNSDSTTTSLGTSEMAGSGDQVTTRSHVSGRITITSAKDFKVKHYTTAAQATIGLGAATSDGSIGVFTVAKFWKVA